MILSWQVAHTLPTLGPQTFFSPCLNSCTRNDTKTCIVLGWKNFFLLQNFSGLLEVLLQISPGVKTSLSWLVSRFHVGNSLIELENDVLTMSDKTWISSRNEILIFNKHKLKIKVLCKVSLTLIFESRLHLHLFRCTGLSLKFQPSLIQVWTSTAIRAFPRVCSGMCLSIHVVPILTVIFSRNLGRSNVCVTWVFTSHAIHLSG